MSDRLRCRVVCEGRRDERFFRELLGQRLKRRDIDFKVAPAGDGSASAWVVAQYPQHVRTFIRSRPSENVALAIVVDGDQLGVAAREVELAASLALAGESPRSATERIALCIPTWHIETWLLALDGLSGLSESVKLKEQFEALNPQPDLASLAVRFFTLTPALPSIVHARTELQRVR